MAALFKRRIGGVMVAISRYLVVLLVSSILIGAACIAQASTPNFSGHWILDGAASKLVMSQKTATLDIKHEGANLEVVTKTLGLTDTRNYKIDGVKRKIDAMGIEIETSAKWQGSSLHTSADVPGVIQSETWQLIDGGKTLTIDRTVSGMAPMKEFFIYRKK